MNSPIYTETIDGVKFSIEVDTGSDYLTVWRGDSHTTVSTTLSLLYTNLDSEVKRLWDDLVDGLRCSISDRIAQELRYMADGVSISKTMCAAARSVAVLHGMSSVERKDGLPFSYLKMVLQCNRSDMTVTCE